MTTGIEIAPVPMFVQSGDDRYNNVGQDGAQRGRRAPARPDQQPGDAAWPEGELLNEFVTWVRDRILSPPHPTRLRADLHFDVYGTSGRHSTAMSNEWRTT